MDDRKLLRFGITGTVLTALCCFTPLLVVFLPAIGFAALVPVLDSVLIPLLAVFVAITGFALWKLKGGKSS